MSTVRRVAVPGFVCTLLLGVLTTPVLAQNIAARWPDRVDVRVYDFTGLPTSVRSAAIAEARAIIDDGGVDARWHDCASKPGAACQPAGGFLMVRIIRAPVDIPLDTRQPLGYAIVQGESGLLATLYLNRIEAHAKHAGADVPTLLGRAIAHELGHLLLGTNSHSERGLMRAVWTDQEMARNHADDWRFFVPGSGPLQTASLLLEAEITDTAADVDEGR